MSIHSPAPRLVPSAIASEAAVSRAVPRLADVRPADKSSLISPAVLAGAVRLAELATAMLVGLLAAALYVPVEDVFGSAQYLLAVALTSLAAVAIFEMLGLYASAALRGLVRHVARLALGWTAALAALSAAVFFLKVGPEFSRVWLVLWLFTGGLALILLRAIVSLLAHRWSKSGRLNRRAVIYGSGPTCIELIQALEADPDTDIRIAGVFDDRMDERSGGASIAGYPNGGSLKQLLDFARTTRIDMVIMAMPISAEARLLDIVKALWVLPVDIRLAGVASKLKFRPHTYSYVGNVPLIDVADKPIADWGLVAKWTFDKLVGLAALSLLAPVMAAVAIAIRLESRGPVLFRQKRYGFNNELIEVYKFRSMYVDQCDAAATRLVTRNDPRVTRIGRFIRASSIDELPQLFNVLKGDLSLVGPRPHAVQAKAGAKLYDEAVDSYFARHKVKPGITGWAQVNGWRGETDTHEKILRRVEHDLYYIENWSLFLDLYILLRTPLSLLSTKNAY
jgi:Undecaprenyl-phosphate glucose phosphotransferase